MIEKAASELLKFISGYVPMDEELSEVYRYGIEITISTALNIILTMAVAVLSGHALCGVLFLACFSAIRSYCGGYHADTYFSCNCVMVILFSTAYILSSIAAYYDFHSLIAEIAAVVVSFIPLAVFSPVKNVHKELSDKKKRRCRIISFVLYWLFSAAGVLVFRFNILYGSIIIIALMEISALILVEITRQRRKYNEAERNNG